MPTLTPVDDDPFADDPASSPTPALRKHLRNYEVAPQGVYDDTMTPEQNLRNKLNDGEERAQNRVPLVTPPEMESDANFPSRVIDPDTLVAHAMGADAAPSYGIGRNRIYTSNQPTPPGPENQLPQGAIPSEPTLTTEEMNQIQNLFGQK